MNLHLWTYLECLQLRGHFVLGGEILFERNCISDFRIGIRGLTYGYGSSRDSANYRTLGLRTLINGINNAFMLLEIAQSCNEEVLEFVVAIRMI